jgi:hypothetical protein
VTANFVLPNYQISFQMSDMNIMSPDISPIRKKEDTNIQDIKLKPNSDNELMHLHSSGTQTHTQTYHVSVFFLFLQVQARAKNLAG